MMEIFSEESIKKSLEFYHLDNDEEISSKTLEAASKIRADKELFDIAMKVREIEFRLELHKTPEEKEFLSSTVFGEKKFPFFAVAILISGWTLHKENMEKRRYTQNDMKDSINSVMYSIIGEIKNRKLPDLTYTYLHWGAHFINSTIIKVLGLQYEYKNPTTVGMHIPAGTDISKEAAIRSIRAALPKIKQYYDVEDSFDLVCTSWLLSPDIIPVLGEDSKILQFQSIYDITPSADCKGALFSFVFRIPQTDDLSKIPEKTSLQRFLKEKLKNGVTIRQGTGTVKKSLI